MALTNTANNFQYVQGGPLQYPKWPTERNGRQIKSKVKQWAKPANIMWAVFYHAVGRFGSRTILVIFLLNNIHTSCCCCHRRLLFSGCCTV